jgi:hypothetical protein
MRNGTRRLGVSWGRSGEMAGGAVDPGLLARPPLAAGPAFAPPRPASLAQGGSQAVENGPPAPRTPPRGEGAAGTGARTRGGGGRASPGCRLIKPDSPGRASSLPGLAILVRGRGQEVSQRRRGGERGGPRQNGMCEGWRTAWAVRSRAARAVRVKARLAPPSPGAVGRAAGRGLWLSAFRLRAPAAGEDYPHAGLMAGAAERGLAAPAVLLRLPPAVLLRLPHP